MIDRCFTGDPQQAIVDAVKKLSGTYALAVMFDSIADTIFAVRNVSPIVCCKNDDGAYLASDVVAIGGYSEDYFVLPEFSVAKITKDGFEISNFKGEPIEVEMLKLDWDISNSGKCGYPFYMEKEIMEQPRVIEKTVMSRIKSGLPDFSCDKVDDEILKKCSAISVVACGTDMLAGLRGKHLK